VFCFVVDLDPFPLADLFVQKMNVVDIEADLGDIVQALFNNRQEWQGKVIPIGVPISFTDRAKAFSDVTGEPCVTVQATVDQAFSFLPPPHRLGIFELMNFAHEFGFDADGQTFAEQLLGRPLTPLRDYWARLKAKGFDFTVKRGY